MPRFKGYRFLPFAVLLRFVWGIGVGGVVIGVPLRVIVQAARQRLIVFPGELAGYIILGALDASRTLGAAASASLDEIRLGDDGRVVIGARKGDVPSGPREYRRILSELLDVANLASPALRHAARGDGGDALGAFSTELSTALVPVNRAAARRRLARLYRELIKVNLAGTDSDEPSVLAAAPVASQLVDVAGKPTSFDSAPGDRSVGPTQVESVPICLDDGPVVSVPLVSPHANASSWLGPASCHILAINHVAAEAEADPDNGIVGGAIPDLEIPGPFSQRNRCGISAIGGAPDPCEVCTPRNDQFPTIERTEVLSMGSAGRLTKVDRQDRPISIEPSLDVEVSSGHTMPLSLHENRPQRDLVVSALAQSSNELCTYGVPSKCDEYLALVPVEYTQRLPACPAGSLSPAPEQRVCDQEEASEISPPEPSIVLPLLRRRPTAENVQSPRSAAIRDDETCIDAVVEVSEDEIEYLLSDNELASIGDNELPLPVPSDPESFGQCGLAIQGGLEFPVPGDGCSVAPSDVDLGVLGDDELTSCAAECASYDEECLMGLSEPLVEFGIAASTVDPEPSNQEVELLVASDRDLESDFDESQFDAMVGSPPPMPAESTFYRESTSLAIRRSDIAGLSQHLLDHSSWTESALCETLRAVAGVRN